MRDEGRQKVMDAIDEHLIRMMRNWVASSGSGNLYAMSTAYCGIADSSGYAEAQVPILLGESEDVEIALAPLALRYRQAVCLFWWYEGASMPMLARRCGEGVDYRTLQARVMRGHEDLSAELYRRRDMHARQREQSEAAMRAALLTAPEL